MSNALEDCLFVACNSSAGSIGLSYRVAAPYLYTVADPPTSFPLFTAMDPPSMGPPVPSTGNGRPFLTIVPMTDSLGHPTAFPTFPSATSTDDAPSTTSPADTPSDVTVIISHTLPTLIVTTLSTRSLTTAITITSAGNQPSTTRPDASGSSTGAGTAATSTSPAPAGIGAGGIAGAVVGSLAGVALLVAALLLLLRRRRARARGDRSSTVPRGTLGGAMVPGARDSPEPKPDSGAPAEHEGKKAPPMSVEPKGEPTGNETPRARYEAPAAAPWSADAIGTAYGGGGEARHELHTPVPSPTSPELDSTAVGPYVPYRPPAPRARLPYPDEPQPLSAHPPTPTAPRRASGAAAATLSTDHAPPSPNPTSPTTIQSSAATIPASPPLSQPSPGPPPGAADAASAAVSPVSSPRTDRAHSPSPRISMPATPASGMWLSASTAAGVGSSNERAPRAVSGLSARGSWTGYLSAEDALAGGWRDVEPRGRDGDGTGSEDSPRDGQRAGAPDGAADAGESIGRATSDGESASNERAESTEQAANGAESASSERGASTSGSSTSAEGEPAIDEVDAMTEGLDATSASVLETEQIEPRID